MTDRRAAATLHRGLAQPRRRDLLQPGQRPHLATWPTARTIEVDLKLRRQFDIDPRQAQRLLRHDGRHRGPAAACSRSSQALIREKLHGHHGDHPEGAKRGRAPRRTCPRCVGQRHRRLRQDLGAPAAHRLPVLPGSARICVPTQVYLVHAQPRVRASTSTTSSPTWESATRRSSRGRGSSSRLGLADRGLGLDAPERKPAHARARDGDACARRTRLSAISAAAMSCCCAPSSSQALLRKYSHIPPSPHLFAVVNEELHDRLDSRLGQLVKDARVQREHARPRRGLQDSNLRLVRGPADRAKRSPTARKPTSTICMQVRTRTSTRRAGCASTASA